MFVKELEFSQGVTIQLWRAAVGYFRTNTLELHYISSRGDKALPKVYHPFLLLKKWAIGPALRGHIQLGMTCL